MSLHLLEIPEGPAAVADWLEEHLAGCRLAELTAELAAVGGNGAGAPPGLDEALGRHLPHVLDEGLSVLPPEALRMLLRRPALLLELQERILIDGGDYWDARIDASNELDRLAQLVWERLGTVLGRTGDLSFAPPALVPASTRRTVARPVRTCLVCLAAAAAVLLALTIWERPAPPPAPVGWGWSRPGALDQDAPRDAYLNALADAAEEWFGKRPAAPADLAARISQFRQGCTALILAEHRPLPPADREWLVERCQAWSGRLDEHLAAVESGRDVLEVRDQADETVRKLIAALRKRADEPA